LGINRKSLIQIFVLLLLVAGGGLGYLYQQEGNLNFINLNFITDLIGMSSTPTPPVPIAKTSPAGPPHRIRKDSNVGGETIAIPSQPAQGEIQKSPFAVETAQIENGVLTLRQGQEPLSTEVKLFLQTKPWQVPAERSFKIAPQSSVSDAPIVRVRWQESGQATPRQREFNEKYSLQLELGREQDRKLPGKIRLVLPDESQSQIAGTFTADVRGFRFIDGKPDLGADAIDTLQYLALREILKDDPDRPIKDVSFQQGRYTALPGSQPTGYIELAYRVGEATPTGQKFQFVKDQGEWRVFGTLRPDQLDEAHPYRLPGPKETPERLFPYLAAKRIETDMQKKLPGRTLKATDFQTRYNEKQKVGVAEVGYKVGDEKPMQAAFLYQLTPAGWTLSRELRPKERVNLATGKVVAQK
jgi:hypothetical protein